MKERVMYRTPATAVLVVVGLLVALGAVLWLGVGPAEAAFPGSNGKIAFMSDRDGDFDIYTMNPDGTGVEKLTFNLVDDHYPVWSADGSKIAFESYRDGDDEIYTMNADGSELRKLTDNSVDDLSPAWSPDGTRIAFESLRDGNEIYTMDANDGSGVERLTNDSATDSGPDWQPLPPPPPPIDVDPILPTPPICSSSRAWWCELLINDPIIRRVPPAPGLIIREHVPPIHLTPIKALVRDRQTDLEKEDIRLFVDGIRENGFSYNQNTDTLSYAVDELSVGRHEVKIVARDAQGNTTTETWSFEVAKR